MRNIYWLLRCFLFSWSGNTSLNTLHFFLSRSWLLLLWLCIFLLSGFDLNKWFFDLRHFMLFFFHGRHFLLCSFLWLLYFDLSMCCFIVRNDWFYSFENCSWGILVVSNSQPVDNSLSNLDLSLCNWVSSVVIVVCCCFVEVFLANLGPHILNLRNRLVDLLDWRCEHCEGIDCSDDVVRGGLLEDEVLVLEILSALV